MRESEPSDPFSLFGLPRRYAVDRAALTRAWLAESARRHPDRPGAPPDAAARLAEVNEAKRILDDPELRADALLRLLGGPAKERDKSLPEGFLAEMMELRQRIEEEVKTEGEPARERWRTWARERGRGHEERVAGLFESFEKSGDAALLRAVRQVLNAWRYVERLFEQLDPRQAPGPGPGRSA